MSTILAFDTSGPRVAVALSCRNALTHRIEDMSRGQGERLLPLCEEIMDAAACRWSDLSCIVVGTGPGNFTGIRIAVSAARGLGLGLGADIRGLSRFDTTVHLAPSAPAVAVPAPRGQIYLKVGHAPPKLVGGDDEEPTAARSDAFSEEEHLGAMIALAQKGAGQSPPAPLYIKPADAAPPRDAPPELIDP